MNENFDVNDFPHLKLSVMHAGFGESFWYDVACIFWFVTNHWPAVVLSEKSNIVFRFFNVDVTRI